MGQAGRTPAILIFAFMLLFSDRALASAEQQEPSKQDNLLEMSLEELMNVEVVTPGRKPQPINAAAADITVITEKEIKDSVLKHSPMF